MQNDTVRALPSVALVDLSVDFEHVAVLALLFVWMAFCGFAGELCPIFWGRWVLGSQPAVSVGPPQPVRKAAHPCLSGWGSLAPLLCCFASAFPLPTFPATNLDPTDSPAISISQPTSPHPGQTTADITAFFQSLFSSTSRSPPGRKR